MIKVPIKADIPPIQIRHKGLFDLENMYKVIRSWLRQKEYDYDEKRYKDKVGDFGNELELEMLGEVRVNSFVKFNLEISGKFYNLKEFEAELGGKKRKVNNSQFFIIIKGSVTYDYNKNFNTKLGNFLLDLLINKIFKNYYDVKYVDRLYYELYGLHTLIKENAFMETASNAY